MKHFFEWILDHKKIVLIFFAISLVVCFYFSSKVLVNYELMDYLPDEAPSTISLDRMEAAYDGGIPNARIMLEADSIAQALAYKAQMEAIEGVDTVTWLDDVVDVRQPLSYHDADTVEGYYQSGYALYTLTLADDAQIEAYEALLDTFGEDAALSGAAINTVAATLTTGPEISRAVKIIILICFAVLFLTTDSLVEPILFMGTIGVAIMLNNGTNILMGEISFVTNAAGSVLQLGVSMDYSIFLLHRFAEFRAEGLDSREAMLSALQKSIGSIASSAFTTIIGFAALILMKFKIGPDMGIAMAKAVFLSLFSVITLLPVLTLYCYKLIDKTHHRHLLPDFHRLASLVYRVRVPALLIFLVIVIPTYLGQQSNTFYYGSSMIFNDESTKVCMDRQRTEDIFGKSNAMVLMVPRGDFATETEMSQKIQQLPQVTSVLSYVDTVGAVIPTGYLDEELLSNLLSDEYSRLVLNVKADYEGDEVFAVVETIRGIASEYYGDAYEFVGESVNTYDLKDVVTDDMARVNAIAIGAVFFTLLIAFKSISLPLILVLAIETAIWVNLSLPYFMDQQLYYLAYLILSSVQLGATVDYAILYTSRYLEEREQLPKREALRKATQSTTLSILTSGTILTFGCMMLGMLCTHGVIKQLGALLSRGAAISVALVVFILPALLYFLDGVIRHTTLGLRLMPNKPEKQKPTKKAKEKKAMKQSITATVTALLCVLAIAIPSAQAGDTGTQQSPVPLGETYIFQEEDAFSFSMRVTCAARGSGAEKILRKWDSANTTGLGSGQEWMLVKLHMEALSAENQLITLKGRHFKFVNEHGVEYTRQTIINNPAEVSSFYVGGSQDVWIGCIIDKDDTPHIVYNPKKSTHIWLQANDRVPEAFDASSPLVRGDDSGQVLRVQERLLELGYFGILPAGEYGWETEEAVRAFQRAEGLAVTGTVDQATADVMFGESHT